MSDLQRLLTTNYDYCFELADGCRRNHANLDRETTYSAFRRLKVGGREIWHIHGELDAPHTIMLGLHQYAGYLQKLRAYLTQRPKTSPFRAGVADFEHSGRRFSWVDLFLRDDVHIGGLTMDYVEIHLWWLIAYKLRLRRDLQCGTTHFYHFHTAEDGAGVETRLGMLCDLGVRVHQVPVRANDWNRAHNRMFDQIEAA